MYLVIVAALAQQGNDVGLKQGRQLGKNCRRLHLLQQGGRIGRLNLGTLRQIQLYSPGISCLLTVTLPTF